MADVASGVGGCARTCSVEALKSTTNDDTARPAARFRPISSTPATPTPHCELTGSLQLMSDTHAYTIYELRHTHTHHDVTQRQQQVRSSGRHCVARANVILISPAYCTCLMHRYFRYLYVLLGK